MFPSWLLVRFVSISGWPLIVVPLKPSMRFTKSIWPEPAGVWLAGLLIAANGIQKRTPNVLKRCGAPVLGSRSTRLFLPPATKNSPNSSGRAVIVMGPPALAGVYLAGHDIVPWPEPSASKQSNQIAPGGKAVEISLKLTGELIASPPLLDAPDGSNWSM